MPKRELTVVQSMMRGYVNKLRRNYVTTEPIYPNHVLLNLKCNCGQPTHAIIYICHQRWDSPCQDCYQSSLEHTRILVETARLLGL